MTYAASWDSLVTHPMPQWFRDAKFGIYTHWGVYSVPAYGANGTWYPRHMYDADRPEYHHHAAVYGHPSEFGYKEFIPMFTAEKFNPDEWADLFQRAGAQFAGPVAEHHDGFSMWSSRANRWNASAMGPRRDVVGDLAQAVRGRGMKFMVSMHHALNWCFFPTWDARFDCADPAYGDLYNGPHAKTEPPSPHFLQRWLAKLHEVVEGYQPDLIWFDAGLGLIPDAYRREFLAYYYNQAEAWGKDVLVTYKLRQMVPGAALIDLEVGKMNELTPHPWLTDTSVDAGPNGTWSFVEDIGYKSVERLVHNLIDRVSKNGYLLLNVGPRADGAIPAQARECLEGVGAWLDVNGEAIYGTTPWLCAGEGPTNSGQSSHFNENNEARFTAQDIRFTCKGDTVYAICLGRPGDVLRIRTMAAGMHHEFPWESEAPPISPDEIERVSLLGGADNLPWRLTDEGLMITVPERMPCQHAFAFRVSFANRT